MTATLVFTDTEGAVRTWLRTHPLLVAAGNGDRVFFGIPAGITYPIITVGRIGGGPNGGLAPLDNPRLSFSVWGNTKKTAADVVLALVSAIEQLENEPLDAATFGHGATVDTILWLPERGTEGDADKPRYIVDATFTTSARSE